MIRKKILFILLIALPFCQSCNRGNSSENSAGAKDKRKSSKSASVQDAAALLQKIDLSISAGKYNEAAYALDALKNIYTKQFKFPEAVSASKKILRFENKISDKELIGSTYNSIGLSYWKLGRLDSSLFYLNKSLIIKRQIGDSLSIAKTYNNLGIVYWKCGDIENSFQNYLLALEMREKLKDIKGVILGLNNVSLVYQRLRYYDVAQENSLRALALSDSVSYLHGKEYSMRRLGALYLGLNNLKDAEKYINQAVTLLFQEDDKNGIAQIYCDMGKIQELKKNYSSAREFFNKSYKLSSEINDQFIKAFAMMNKGRIDIIQEKYSDALRELNKARALASDGHYIVILKDISLNQSLAYKALGDKENALSYLNEHLMIKDSLLNSTLLGSIGEMKTRYQIEKSKERQLFLQKEVETKSRINILLIISIGILLLSFSAIILLYIRQRKLAGLLEHNNSAMASINETLKCKNTELTVANNTKQKLFTIIAHDLKNPFTSILGFAYLIKETSEKIRNEELASFADSLLISSQKLVSLIANLTGWALLQKDGIRVNPVIFNIYQLTDEIVKTAALNAELKKIEISNEMPQSAEAFADREMIATVIRNILSNAIKFTQKEGRVKISGSAESNFFKLTIKDSGVGMTQEKISCILSGDNHISGAGTENEKGTGLGLSVSREFIVKNNGLLTIESQLNAGSKFTISIPLGRNKRQCQMLISAS
jgi:signal transduction histidine kinase